MNKYLKIHISYNEWQINSLIEKFSNTGYLALLIKKKMRSKMLPTKDEIGQQHTQEHHLTKLPSIPVCVLSLISTKALSIHVKHQHVFY